LARHATAQAEAAEKQSQALLEDISTDVEVKFCSCTMQDLMRSGCKCSGK